MPGRDIHSLRGRRKPSRKAPDPYDTAVSLDLQSGFTSQATAHHGREVATELPRIQVSPYGSEQSILGVMDHVATTELGSGHNIQVTTEMDVSFERRQ